MTIVRTALTLGLMLTLATDLAAQTIGTFRWQMQPHCNVVTVTVTQVGGSYRLEGVDDQCGAATRAAVNGVAFPNPNGTIGLGFTIVATPGGSPVHVDASVTLPTLAGTWRDSAGRSGAFVFTSGAGTGGSPRPVAGRGVQFQVAGHAPLSVPSMSNATVSTWTSVLYNDGGGTYTAAAGTYTVPVSGLYSVQASVYWSDFNSSGLGVVIWRGGSVIAQVFTQASAAGTSGVVQPVSTVYKFNAGDTVRVTVFQSSGATRSLNFAADGAANFAVTLIR